MAVKRSQSAARVLAVLEKIVTHQPIGVSELARQLGTDKSAVQRAIMTLADEGWIRAAPGTPTRWQPTAHILAVAHIAFGGHDLRRRVRSVLEGLRDESGESALLTVPDIRRFVVVDVVESRQLLRSVPTIGLAVPVRGSATSRAILPYMSREQQSEWLGARPDAALLEDFSLTLARGYAVSSGDVIAGSTNIAAPIREVDGRPIGALVVSAPSDRVAGADHARIGAMVSAAARSLSQATVGQGLGSTTRVSAT